MTDDHAIEAAARAMLSHVMFDGDTVLNWLEMMADDAERDVKAMLAPAIRAYLAAMEAEGWVLCPVEPTPEMLKAAAAAMSPGHRPDRWVSCSEKHGIRYTAMLASRPKIGEV